MELLVGATLCALNSVSTMKLTWSMAGPILLFLSIMVATGDHKLLGQRTWTNWQSCFCMPEREQACVHQRELQPCRNSAPFLHTEHHSICHCTTVSEIQLPPPNPLLLFSQIQIQHAISFLNFAWYVCSNGFCLGHFSKVAALSAKLVLEDLV